MVEVGVTIYSTVPDVVLLGLSNTSLIVLPDPGSVYPVMPPVTVPTVHAKLLGALAVNTILVFALLQMLFVAAVVTAGFGLTVTVMV